jgi:hypothetical protein
LFTGFDDGNGGREFRGDREATRSAIAVVAVRATEGALSNQGLPGCPSFVRWVGQHLTASRLIFSARKRATSVTCASPTLPSH